MANMRMYYDAQDLTEPIEGPEGDERGTGGETNEKPKEEIQHELLKSKMVF